tara:strand:- start:627 stop:1175 length:549 start_codon:yes stop_codon:yes gene_type:complete
MTLDKLLANFYRKNRIPSDGGVNKNNFRIKAFGINLNLPNPKFRKDVTHIHDIHHILNKCNANWKGEAFIAGWEISTGFWKYFPICIISLWAMAYSLWLHTKAVLKGFKKGLNNIGVIDLKLSRSELMKLEFDQLINITTKEKTTQIVIIDYLQFLFWVVISQLIFLFPLILIITSIIYLKK